LNHVHFLASNFGSALCLCCNPQDDEDPELDEDIDMSYGEKHKDIGSDAEVQINAKEQLAATYSTFREPL
jgi:hypothetical protein